jgi:CBS domain-containing protein
MNLDGTAPLSRAARQIIEEQIGALPVLDAAGRLTGIVTAVDLLRHAARALA